MGGVRVGRLLEDLDVFAGEWQDLITFIMVNGMHLYSMVVGDGSSSQNKEGGYVGGYCP